MTFLTFLLLACGAGTTSEAQRKADAEATVEAFFAATATGDCKTILSLVDEKNTEEDCRKMVEEFQHRGTHLDGISKVVVDGRNPKAFIVHTRLSEDGKSKDVLVRAVWSPDGWTLVL